MALRAPARLPCVLQRKAVLGWGGALAVGLAAMNWRSIAGGDVRAASTLSVFERPRFIRRDLNSRTLFTSCSRSSIFSLLNTTPTMGLTAPQPPPAWDHTAEDITRLTKELIEKDRIHQDKIGALAPKDCNFSSVSLNGTCTF